jgi:hypothetical protein
LATAKSRATTHRKAQVRSADRRAEPAPKPVVRVVHPAGALPVAVALHAQVGDAGDDRFIHKEKTMKPSRRNSFSVNTCSTLFAIVACCMLATALFATPQTKTAQTVATQSPQKTFATAQQAADVMILAVKNDDVAALLEIFGPAGKDFVDTKDDVQDKNSRAAFAALAQEKMHVDVDPDNPNRAILSVGSEDWPIPIPIVRQSGMWHFDSKAGRTEILDRHIGANELEAITICRGFVEAQNDYAEQIHDDSGVNQYAQLIISTPGKQDGLAWQNSDGSWGGPVGEAAAKALAEGYGDKRQPFHGYYFKLLKGQGPAAPLGQLDYVIEGAMIGGFALVAVPAEYGVTGVMTFMVSYDGVVFQKDLGPDSLDIVKKLERYNPDKTWHPTDDEE